MIVELMEGYKVDKLDNVEIAVGLYVGIIMLSFVIARILYVSSIISYSQSNEYILIFGGFVAPIVSILIFIIRKSRKRR
jgi:hypothetical protein